MCIGSWFSRHDKWIWLYTDFLNFFQDHVIFHKYDNNSRIRMDKKKFDFRYQVFVCKNWLFQMICFFDIYELIRIRSLTRVSLLSFHSVVTSFQMLETGRRSGKYIIWYHFKKILHILTLEKRLTRKIYNVINPFHVLWKGIQFCTSRRWWI